jgi:hypothetical protein
VFLLLARHGVIQPGRDRARVYLAARDADAKVAELREIAAAERGHTCQLASQRQNQMQTPERKNR